MSCRLQALAVCARIFLSKIRALLWRERKSFMLNCVPSVVALGESNTLWHVFAFV